MGAIDALDINTAREKLQNLEVDLDDQIPDLLVEMIAEGDSRLTKAYRLRWAV